MFIKLKRDMNLKEARDKNKMVQFISAIHLQAVSFAETF